METLNIRNLIALEQIIEAKRQMLANDPNINPDLIKEVKNDLMYVRGLMDDIECGRIAAVATV